MTPAPTEGLWCVCRKYCKGVRRQLNTPHTWRRHLREAADDEIEAIRLARRSDNFRAYISDAAGTSTSSSHKRSSNQDMDGDDSAKRARTSPQPLSTPQAEDDFHSHPEGDSYRNMARDHDATDLGGEGGFMGADGDDFAHQRNGK
ncbi:hypothetical protein PISMIDRAFT_23472 [Pisolithus microcarpus 441]|uniref:Uncharacterized protein n=1 Tax=Pisolithus microcarpus 441 TaxID=765257 RepID=A0A0C9Z338_9AGAM|nr:hypothetical protein PISMIDRAFT_23472 [Pisolithus microcarpus 441]